MTPSTNRAFRDSFEAFYALCRQAINPNLTRDAVEKMLIQHLLTERIFRRVFHAEEFRSRNVIAAEIEKVITSMTSRQFSRDQFLSDLDRFYKAIERAAEDKDDYSEKQAFLNTVYERFFQGYSPKEADTHGIVYTPQPIVDFMVRSVEDILKKEFGRSLADHNVHILDPFVGTGNFITRVMRQIAETDKGALPYKYEHELHCNEVMLLPYYIASMNIEHEYLAQTGEYKPFDGICLVDTFELAEPEQGGLEFMTEENTERVKRQKQAPIFVIIGNPPYNSKQLDESDENKNRKYPAVDDRIAATYTAGSIATLRNKLSDPYVRAVRWATDRLPNQGLIAFITNNSFLDQIAFDGMRKHLATDFSSIYMLDLGGNVRKNPKLSGSTHNVFGIQIGVVVSLFVRNVRRTDGRCQLHYASADEWWTKEQKYRFMDSAVRPSSIEWHPLVPDKKNSWLACDHDQTYQGWPPLGDKAVKRAAGGTNTLFELFSLGVVTSRDAYAYNFDRDALKRSVTHLVEHYSASLDRFRRNRDLPESVLFDISDTSIKWTRQVKAALRRGAETSVTPEAFRRAIYRPFTKTSLYFDDFWNEEQYKFRSIFPTESTEKTNLAICGTGPGAERPFASMMVNVIPDLNFYGPGTVPQWFPFYKFSEDGSSRRENITDWALQQFRSHYHDPSISKWDIFHYVYAVLHHPEYRSRYAANLKRELPRIPFLSSASSASSATKVFRSFVDAGKRLAELHVHYEQQPEYPLEKLWKPTANLDYRVTKMRLANKDKSILFYNEALTLKGIPLETCEYRLGNRSALEWVIDQYQVSTDKRSGITNDPNRADDREYILRLIGQVITVSLETVQIVKSLPEFVIADSTAATGA